MGIGSHFNCCKGTLRNTLVIITDEDEKKEKKEEEVKKEDNRNNIDKNNISETNNSNHNTNAEYTFQPKSSVSSKGTVIIGEGSGYVNNEPFRPVNIPEKVPKESQDSFNAMFQKLN